MAVCSKYLSLIIFWACLVNRPNNAQVYILYNIHVILAIPVLHGCLFEITDNLLSVLNKHVGLQKGSFSSGHALY